MQERIYEWVRNLAVFYIIFTAVLHLVPDKGYERYIRAFMGLLLVYMLSISAAGILGNSTEMLQEFRMNYETEKAELESAESENPNLQEVYLAGAYEQEAEKEILKICQKYGINPEAVTVYIEGEQVTAVVRVPEEPDSEQKEMVLDELRRTLGIQEEDCQIVSDGENDGDGQAAVDRASAAGTPAVRDRTAGIG